MEMIKVSFWYHRYNLKKRVILFIDELILKLYENKL